MASPRTLFPSLSIRVFLNVVLGLTMAASAGTAGESSAWTDGFKGTAVDTSRWIIANGRAPGYIPNTHIGYYDPIHVSEGGGYLAIFLTQDNGQVDTNQNGVISTGGAIYTQNTYGYGTYAWRMRMSSTATTPTGPGQSVSGSVSAGFIYTNNSKTEIDFEFSALTPDVLYMTNWLNTNPSSDPADSAATTSTAVIPHISDAFHTYKFVWQQGIISFYVDDVLQAVHTTNVPSSPANFFISLHGTDSVYFGGLATVGMKRYFYVDWVSYTPIDED